MSDEHASHAHHRPGISTAPGPSLPEDPVCGMAVDPTHAAGSHTHAGVTYFFCGSSCLERFRTNPGAYIAPASSPQPEGATSPAPGAETAWTCPMHPEIVRSGPGTCPI